MRKRHRFLRVLAWVLRVEAWAFLVLGVAASAYAASFAAELPILGLPSSGLVFVVALAFVLWYCVPVLCLAEVIFLLLRLEQRAGTAAPDEREG